MKFKTQEILSLKSVFLLRFVFLLSFYFLSYPIIRGQSNLIILDQLKEMNESFSKIAGNWSNLPTVVSNGLGTVDNLYTKLMNSTGTDDYIKNFLKDFKEGNASKYNADQIEGLAMSVRRLTNDPNIAPADKKIINGLADDMQGTADEFRKADSSFGTSGAEKKDKYSDMDIEDVDFLDWIDQKDSLIKLNSTNFQTLDSLFSQDYILKNKEECLKLQSNIEHIIEFNQFGNCMNHKNFPNLDSITIPIQNIDGFEIPLPSRMLVRITENDSVLIMTIVRTSTKKPIHWNQKTDQFCYKSKFPQVKTIYDENVEKNKVLVSHSMYNEKLINGILLQRRDFVNEKLYEIIKKINRK